MSCAFPLLVVKIYKKFCKFFGYFLFYQTLGDYQGKSRYLFSLTNYFSTQKQTAYLTVCFLLLFLFHFTFTHIQLVFESARKIIRSAQNLLLHVCKAGRCNLPEVHHLHKYIRRLYIQSLSFLLSLVLVLHSSDSRCMS